MSVDGVVLLFFTVVVVTVIYSITVLGLTALYQVGIGAVIVRQLY